ncbi:hypothetical protein SAMN05421863_10574 [Nitrosomonas communis]|uniref:Uncharacterized protein n=1 Tax=Nitrosomonas communis TaxID=44574 RepID=A0A1I4TZU0_9PROT|nr:hypothetical protein SAMN05421863_10574 [Nitrosomonas communis]
MEATRRGKGAGRPGPPVGISGVSGAQTDPLGAHSRPLRGSCGAGMGIVSPCAPTTPGQVIAWILFYLSPSRLRFRTHQAGPSIVYSVTTSSFTRDSPDYRADLARYCLGDQIPLTHYCLTQRSGYLKYDRNFTKT